MQHLESSFARRWNLDTSENRSEILRKFWNVVKEKDGKFQLGQTCEKLRSVTKSRGGEEYPPNNKTKDVQLNWSSLA